MFRKSFLAFMVFLSALSLASLACGIRILVNKFKTGPTQTEEINIPLPDEDETPQLYLNFGAGELSIEPGDDDALLTGTATFNVEDLRPDVDSNGSDITLRQGNEDFTGFSTIEGNIKNTWELFLGSMPVKLDIKAGAYDGTFEFGGLAIEKLVIQDGAANVRMSFSEPNTTEMSLLRYETGASDVTLSELANANFSEMEFRGGAGDYTLDFTGELQQDADVLIESGVSSITIIVPEGMNVELTFEGGLTSVKASGDWEQKGTRYLQDGEGPTLVIRVRMGAGDLKLENP